MVYVSYPLCRIVNTSSAVGLYGNFGQCNYSAAKAAIWAFSSTLALEGARAGIKVNCIAPNAGTAMTATILPSEVVAQLKPDYVAPLVLYLASPACAISGKCLEVGSGWMAGVRWERSQGVKLPAEQVNMAGVATAWPQITSFSRVEYPTTPQESFSRIMGSGEEQGASEDDELKGKGNYTYTSINLFLFSLSSARCHL